MDGTRSGYGARIGNARARSARRRWRVLLALCAIALAPGAAAALVLDLVEGADPPEAQLSAALLAPGGGISIVPGSVSVVGRAGDGVDPNTAQSAVYTGLSLVSTTGGPTIANPDGILLTSGVANLPFQNTDSSFDHFSVGVSAPLTGGDADLSNLINTGTNDANALAFRFTVEPGVTSVSAKFVFGSEEFPDQGVTDVFGFFVDGVNYAFFQDGSLVSFVQGANAANFNSNVAGGYAIEYDGLSNSLTVIGQLGVLGDGETEHTIKIAIADTSDDVFDSGVFIGGLAGGESLCSGVITADVALDPPSANQSAGGEHTVTATLTDEGAPLAGATLSFVVESGPNAGASGEAVTDANGRASFTYTDDGEGEGDTDVIRSTYVDENECPTSGTASVEWGCAAVPGSIALSTADPFKPSGDDQTVTATLAQGGSGVPVTFEITSGPNAGASGQVATDANGQASLVYEGGGGAGTDAISAGFLDADECPQSAALTVDWYAVGPAVIAPVGGNGQRVWGEAVSTGGGSVVWMAAQEGGLVPFETADASDPFALGAPFAPPECAEIFFDDVHVADEMANIAGGNCGVVMADVSDPLAPDVRGVYDADGQLGYAKEAAVYTGSVGGYGEQTVLFVADYFQGLWLALVEDAGPGNLAFQSERVPIGPGGLAGAPIALDVVAGEALDDRVWVATTEGLFEVDPRLPVGDADLPVVVSSCTTNPDGLPFSQQTSVPQDVEVAGGVAYVPLWVDGLMAIPTDALDGTCEGETVPTSQAFYKVAIGGNDQDLLLATEGQCGLPLFQIIGNGIVEIERVKLAENIAGGTFDCPGGGPADPFDPSVPLAWGVSLHGSIASIGLGRLDPREAIFAQVIFSGGDEEPFEDGGDETPAATDPSETVRAFQQQFCGLLGIEPFLVLGPLGWWRRRRARRG